MQRLATTLRNNMNKHWLRVEEKFVKYANWRLNEGPELLPQVRDKVCEQLVGVCAEGGAFRMPVSKSGHAL